MINETDDIDAALERSLRKTTLSESELQRILAGERLVHDIDIHPDKIGEIIDQVCSDFEVEHKSFDWSEYYFIAGGFVDTFINWRFIPASRRHIENRFKPMDIQFLRSVVNQKKMPPY